MNDRQIEPGPSAPTVRYQEYRDIEIDHAFDISVVWHQCLLLTASIQRLRRILSEIVDGLIEAES